MMTKLLSPAVLALALLSACSSLPPAPTQAELENSTIAQRTAALNGLQRWQVQGKIAFIQGNQRDSASLNWQVDQQQNEQSLSLTSYLGINVLNLSSSQGLYQIDVDGKHYQGEDLNTLLYSLTRLYLPTEAMKDWLKGLKHSEQDSISYDENTQLPQTLTSYYDHQLWKIEYANYRVINHYLLAQNFTISSQQLRIKLHITKWQL